MCAAGMLVSREAPPTAVTVAVLSPARGTLSPRQRRVVAQRFGERCARAVTSLCEPDIASWSDRKQAGLSQLSRATATAVMAATALRIAWATEVVRLVAEGGSGVLADLEGGPYGAVWLSRALLATVRHSVPSSMYERLEALCRVTESVLAAAHGL